MLDSPPSSPSLFVGVALCGCWRESLSFLDFIFGANGEREKGESESEGSHPCEGGRRHNNMCTNDDHYVWSRYDTPRR